MALVDATGHYTIRLLAAGEQRLMGMQWPHPDLKAHSDAYAMESKIIVAKDGDRQQLDFVIYPGAYGSVDITNPGGLPIEQMVVDVVRHGLDPSTRDSFIRTTAGGVGSWSFVGAPAGDHVGAATVRVPGGSGSSTRRQ